MIDALLHQQICLKTCSKYQINSLKVFALISLLIKTPSHSDFDPPSEHGISCLGCIYFSLSSVLTATDDFRHGLRERARMGA